MTYWTLTYNGVENVFDEDIQPNDGLGLGLKGGVLNRVSLDADVFSVTAESQNVDSADLFAFESSVVIRRNRTRVGSSGNTYTGGSIYFQGSVSRIRRSGAANGESIQYRFSNLWWLLSRIVFTQTWPYPFTTSHVIMNLKPDFSRSIIGVRSQIQAILDCALADLGAVFTYDVSGIPDIFPPTDEKRDITCDEAVKSQARWVPGLTTWVDYSGAVPKIYFVTRFGGSVFDITPTTAMPIVTMDIGDGVSVSSASISSLDELVSPQVIILFEQTNKVDNVETTSVTADIYPVSPVGGKKTNIFRGTITLLGGSVNDQKANLTTQPIANTTTDAWWKDAHNYLNNVTNLHIHDIIYADSSGNALTPLAFELLNDGCIHDWMRVGNASSGAVAQKLEVHVKALVDYTDVFGNVFKNEEVSSTIKTTNLDTRTYNRVTVTQYAEPQPTGLAQYFFNILSTLLWEGELKVDNNGGEVSATQFLGKLLNVNGGLTAWQTMNALIHSTEEDLETGVVTVKFGRNRYLSPGDLVDLIRVTRRRINNPAYGQYLAVGTSVGNDIQMPSVTAKKDSIKGNKEKNKSVSSYTDPADLDAIQTRLISDAINREFAVETDDIADGSFTLNLDHLVQNDNLN